MEITNPRLKAEYSVHRINENSVMLLGESGGTLLSGKAYTIILETIANEELSIHQLVEKMLGFRAPHQVIQIVGELAAKNYVEERPALHSLSKRGFWESMGINQLPVSLKRMVEFQALGNQNLNLIYQLCDEMDVPIGQGGVKVVLTDDYSREELRKINECALMDQASWLLVKANGTKPQLGPIFIPEETACWECLEHRLTLHQPERNLMLANGLKQKKIARPNIKHPVAERAFLHLCLLEITKWVSGQPNPKLMDHLLQFNYQTLETEYHRVIKRPQCPKCGDSGLIQSLITIEKRPMVNKNGGYRELTSEATWKKYQHHISPVTGIVPFVRQVNQQELPFIHNYTAGPNLAFNYHMDFLLSNHPRGHNGGKGKSDAQARTGALCEAIERYSLVHHGQPPSVSGSYEKLDRAIHPNACMLYSDHQYNNRNELNKKNSRFYCAIPKPFEENLTIDWTAVYSLVEDQFYYLPSFYCFAHYSESNGQNYEMAYPDTNGGASGNSPEEAILQGFLELVERDAVAIWWYNRLKRPAINLEEIADEYIQQVRAYYHSINREIHVLDLTSDLGIPVFGAISYLKDGFTKGQKILFGFGAHLDAQIALDRAITEMNQLLAIDGPDGYRTDDPVFVNWLDQATLDNQHYLAPKEVKSISDYRMPCEANLYRCIETCIKICKDQGLNLLVLNLTQPDVRMPVVKVIVPGLRHFWWRTAPGRLYDVPVKMGHITQPLLEEELNPIPLFI